MRLGERTSRERAKTVSPIAFCEKARGEGEL